MPSETKDASDASGQDTSRRILEEAELASNVNIRITEAYAKRTRVVTDRNVSRTRKMSKIQRC